MKKEREKIKGTDFNKPTNYLREIFYRAINCIFSPDIQPMYEESANQQMT